MFGFVPLSVLQMGAVVVIALGYIVATEAAKAWFFRLENTAQLVAQASAS